MLYISFKRLEDAIYDVDAYFNFNYDDAWLDNAMVKEMVKSIDKSEVISPMCIESPVLGQIPPQKLSGGVEALILLLMEPERRIYATACGDNCADWILKIAKMQDIKIVLQHTMPFMQDFEGVCEDNGKRIHNLDDYWRCRLECL